MLNNSDRGSGTVLSVMLIASICAVGYLMSVLVLLHQSRWQVQTAADFGALAAASAWRAGFEPCAAATEAVRRNSTAQNQVSLSGCSLQYSGRVQVTAAMQINLVGARTITAVAAAGPRPP